MADQRISQLAAIGAVADTDEFAIVDKSDTTDSVDGTTKRGTYADLVAAITSISPNLTIENTDAEADLILDAGGTAGNMDARVRLNNDGTVRWVMIYDESTDQFRFDRYNGAGVFQDSPVTIDGATGDVEISEKEVTVTDISPASNFTASLIMIRYGKWATMVVTITRQTSNIGASSATVATVGAAGRGLATGFGQALAIRTSAASALDGTSIRFDADTGALTAEWHSAWNTGVAVSFSGVVYMGESA